MNIKLNFLNSIAGIRLLFIFGVMIPLSVIPVALQLKWSDIFSKLTSSVSVHNKYEGRDSIGAFNRAQQAYFAEHNRFADSFEALELESPLADSPLYHFSIVSSMNPDQNQSKQHIVGIMMIAYPQGKWKKDLSLFIGGTFYDSQNRYFSTTVCRANFSDIDPNSLQLLNSKMAIYPYQSGINSTQKELSYDDIFPCPDGFQEVR